jgi:hypothetical protein
MTLQIRPGRNVWVLGRTDRDAPSQQDAEVSAAAWLARLFGESAFTFEPGTSIPAEQGGGLRYALGAARPVDVRASQTRPALPGAGETWHFESDQPEALALRAEHPWYVLADFDWRGPSQVLERWPHRAINQWGLEVDEPLQLDWLLLEARALGTPAERPDAGFLDRALPSGPQVRQGLEGLVFLALLVLWSRK